MSISNDAGHYFQTSSALATTERKSRKAKNNYGNPTKFPSKILAVLADPDDERLLYVAEAAGEVKKINVDTGTIQRISNDATAPLTGLAICPQTRTFFAGCWDKSIYTISLSNPRQQPRRKLTGHADFVKCILATSLNGKPILISGGADAAIIVWDITTGTQLHKLKGHTQALQDLAIDPLSFPEGATEPSDSLVLFSASSDREIRRWDITLASAAETQESIDDPILAHDTSVYALVFDSEGDLWTASADKSAKHLGRSRGWEADTTLPHPDFVRDVVVMERLGVVVTACRDEEVRVWDMATGELVCTYSGHFEEVTGLVGVGTAEVVSVGIDGTMRRWGLRGVDMEKYREEVEKEKSGDGEEGGVGTEGGGSALTAEEEAELAELMDDD